MIRRTAPPGHIDFTTEAGRERIRRRTAIVRGWKAAKAEESEEPKPFEMPRGIVRPGGGRSEDL